MSSALLELFELVEHPLGGVAVQELWVGGRGGGGGGGGGGRAAPAPPARCPETPPVRSGQVRSGQLVSVTGLGLVQSCPGRQTLCSLAGQLKQ